MIAGGLDPIIRIIVVGTCAYLALVLMLRVSGKRTLSKLNAFDLVVTVAIGSTLATTLLSRDVALLDGLVALGLLILLQYLVAWSTLRWPFLERLVRADPTVVARDGIALPAARAQRLLLADLESAARAAGLRSVEEAREVVLETDGSITVVPATRDEDRVAASRSDRDARRLSRDGSGGMTGLAVAAAPSTHERSTRHGPR